MGNGKLEKGHGRWSTHWRFPISLFPSPMLLLFLSLYSFPSDAAQDLLVVGGGYQTLALTVDGEVVEWGELAGTVPRLVSGLDHITNLAAGLHHMVALKNDGTVWTWGDNSHGQLGNGNGFNTDRPVQVPGLTGAIGIAAGAYHTFALKNDGTIWAWGDNRNGQLGDGTRVDRYTPVLVEGFLNITKIAAGVSHLVVLRQDGSVCSWGLVVERNRFSAAPPGTVEPYCFEGLSDVADIAAGGNSSFVLKRDGTAWAIGATAPLLDRVKKLAAGVNHLLLLRDDGSVWAVGQGSYGKLGYGGDVDQERPIQVGGGLFNIVAIGAGFNHSVARSDNGSVWTWGDNSQGQLGTGDRQSRPTPASVWDGTGQLRS